MHILKEKLTSGRLRPSAPIHIVRNIDPLALLVETERTVRRRVKQRKRVGTVIDDGVEIIHAVAPGVREILVTFGAGKEPPSTVIH